MTNADNVRRFKAELADVLRNRVPAQANVILRKIGLQALRGVIFASPVDTGRFRGAWQVQNGSAAASITARLDPGGQLTMAAGEAELLRATIDAPVYITNNVPYAGSLEAGRSKQAPEGIVGITLARLKSQFDRERL